MGIWARTRPAMPALALSLLAIGMFFHAEIVTAVHVWNSSTAYGHCWLVLPIAAYIAYDRRHQAAATLLHPRAGVWLLGLPLVVLWLAADLLGIMEGRQLVLIGFVQLVLLAVCGPRLWGALAAAFLYLFFLVPFGAFLTPALQHFTTSFIAHGLNLLGIANRVTENRIEIPEGLFYVAEACAGLRFLIASAAFGVLYALIMFRSAGRRALFIAASCVVPVIANGFRALGIVVLGHLMGSADAAAADHLLYGWIFFSFVIVALAGAGFPFRQDAAPAAVPAAVPRRDLAWPAILAVLPVLMVAGLGPALAHLLVASNAVQMQAHGVLIAPAGCAEVAHDQAGGGATQNFVCGQTRVTSRLLVLPRRVDPARVVALAQAQPALLLAGADLDAGYLTVPGENVETWVLDRDPAGGRAAAYVMVVDGAPALGGLRDRIALARGLFSGGKAPGVLAVAVTQAAGDPAAALRAFLAAQGNWIGRLEGAAPRPPIRQ